jgi:chaperone BCS1
MSPIDVIFPGFSMVSTTAHQLLAGNLDSYTRLFCIFGVLVLFTRYGVNYVWGIVRTYFSSYACSYDGMSLTV